MTMNFDLAFSRLVDPQHEGGFTADPKDRGNWTGGEVGAGQCKGTKYGISAASYPAEDIAGLTLDRVKVIYERDFWGPAGCDGVPDLLKYELFDFAVNTAAPGRPATAIKVLQLAAGVDADGALGPRTLLAAQTMEPSTLLRRFFAFAMRHYTQIPPERRDRYLAGWMNRIATNMLEPA